MVAENGYGGGANKNDLSEKKDHLLVAIRFRPLRLVFLFLCFFDRVAVWFQTATAAVPRLLLLCYFCITNTIPIISGFFLP